MTSRARIRRAFALTLALLLVPAALARADAAYDKVAAAYARSGGQLDACSFTQQELQAGLDGIPRALVDVVPDLRRAIEDGIRAHEAGDCRGIPATGGGGAATTPGAAAPGGTTPSAETPGATPAPGAPSTTPASPGAAAPTPGAATPGATPSADGTLTTPSVQPPAVARDRTPLVVGLIALAAALLGLLLLWGWARLRGWDPVWAARARHACGEAGDRMTATWSEFTDWLRLGR
jgi:hypothetical protein